VRYRTFLTHSLIRVGAINLGAEMPKGVRHVDSLENRLLSALPNTEYRRWRQHLQRVPLSPGQVLLGPGKIQHVYFPISGVAAEVVQLKSGGRIGAAMIGREGIVPLSCYLLLEDAPFRAVVQNAGEAWRMSAKDFRAMSKSGGLLHSNLLRFTAAFATQVSLAAACSRLHHVQQQYCRWLLMTHNRVGADEFALTQDAVAGMLGVRRVSVTAAARQLLKKGLIDYRRGKVRILNRPGLERMGCECYRRTYATYKTVLGGF
jgi:CRP-like cAMP-binding protein